MKQLKKCLAALVLAAATMALGGCAKQEADPLSVTGFAFDTVYTITLYDGGSEELLDSCVEKCSAYEQVFSRTAEESELYQVNEIEKLYGEAVEENEVLRLSEGEQYSETELSMLTDAIEEKRPDTNTASYEISQDGSISFTVSDLLAQIVGQGLSYAEDSGGGFDIAIEPISSLWDFTAADAKIPEDADIRAALALVDSTKVSVEDGKLCFAMPDMGLDLGGIAKGFIADQLKEYFIQEGVSGAVINLGGDVMCVGSKADGSAYQIGVQLPFGDQNEIAATVSITDQAVVSSGIYERYIEAEDGTIYHHILDPATGYSYDNDLASVTILSDSAAQGDALATTCFALGSTAGMEYINSLEGVCAMFITKDNVTQYSDGFEDFLAE